MTTNDYLSRNRALARQIVGQKLRSVVRLHYRMADEPARLEWGEALVETHDDKRYLFDCEESQSNIILFEVPRDGGPIRDKLARLPVRLPIASDAPDDPLGFMLETSIVQIEEVSRAQLESDRPHWYEMCGLRLTFESGAQVIVGTELTTARSPSTAFLLPAEVDPSLRYSLLRS